LKISKETCLKFKQTKNPRKALFSYQPGPFYETNLGKRREIPHRIFVAKGKEEIGKTIRETLRALGVDYEHNRYDRDKYIIIHRNSIKQRFLKYFIVKNSTSTFNIGYDYRSVMHFSEDEYGIFGRRVITAKNKLMQNLMGKTQDLTFYDAKLVNKRYCRFPSQIHPPCHNYGYSHPKSPICKCPSFADGIDCTGVIANNHFCTAGNHFYAGLVTSTTDLKVGGNCTFYIHTDYGEKIRLKLLFHNNRRRHRTCKDFRSVEVRYKSDLAASGILFCPDNTPILIKSEAHLVIIQSHFPPEQTKLRIIYKQVS
uniref:Metalloendopeptidase n=1 Tax=Strongyloides papillosus TaxID=174720 RepID=A0A0N5C530_STREA